MVHLPLPQFDSVILRLPQFQANCGNRSHAAACKAVRQSAVDSIYRIHTRQPEKFSHLG